ncbi:MAG: peptidoglycan-binding protein [Rhodobacter sp.]|nr:peptidoglycan-binding protein [Rhodobacter sp.]
MKFKSLASGAVIASLSFSPVSPLATPARADGKDVVAGLIIGGIIGSAVASENAKKKKKSTSKSKSKSSKSSAPKISPEQKAANVEVQSALNHFGWPVGTADGALGPKSKAAVKEYQAFLGYPATGELTEQERLVLVTAFHRSEAGGSAIAEIVSASVYGLRGVLIAQQDEMAGDTTMAAAAPLKPDDGLPAKGSVAAAAAAAIPSLMPEQPTVAAPAASIVPTPAPAPVVVPAATVPAPAAPEVAPEALPVVAAEPDNSGPGLPTFMDANGAKGSLVADCNTVAMQTSTNGGYVTVATMDDPGFALAEQFCLARTYAVAKGQELTSKIAGFTSDQIAAQCAALAPALKDHVAAVSLRPVDEVLAGVESFIMTSGVSPAQLSGTAKVCLGVGYTQDQMDVAIGSALLLTAMGEKGYAELLGHHLARGFGAAERSDLAEGWYEMAVEAIGNGGAIFAPGLAGRDDLILRAAYSLNGHGDELAPEAAVQEAALPTFTVTPEPEAVVPVAPVSAPVVEAAPAPEVTAEVAPEIAPVIMAEPAPDAAPALGIDGPGADAIRMSAEVARMAVTLPLMALAGN